MNRFALVPVAAGVLAAQNHTREKEAALGRELMADVERNYGLVADPVVCGYVDGIVTKLGAAAGRFSPFTVRVLKTADFKAGFFPGGQLFLSAGLLLRAGSEGQVAAVLAHELAHSVARQGVSRSGEAMPITFIVPCTRYEPNVLLPIAVKRASKGFETDADALGRGYLAKAGYDPQVMATAFEDLRRPSLRPRPPAEPALEAVKPQVRQALCNGSRKE